MVLGECLLGTLERIPRELRSGTREAHLWPRLGLLRDWWIKWRYPWGTPRDHRSSEIRSSIPALPLRTWTLKAGDSGMWNGLENKARSPGTEKGAQMCRGTKRPPGRSVISRSCSTAWIARETGFRKVGGWVPPKLIVLSHFTKVLANKRWIQGSEVFLPVLKISSLCPSPQPAETRTQIKCAAWLHVHSWRADPRVGGTAGTLLWLLCHATGSFYRGSA